MDQAQSLQAHAYLQSALFRSFEFKEPEEEVEEEDQSVVSFAFQLKVLVQCLNVFGHATPALLSEANSNDHTLNDTSNQTSTDETSLKMVYVGVGEPLEIMLEDKGVVTVCRLSTFIHDTNATAIPFINPQTPISHRLIIQSAWLHAALMEADASTEIVGFSLSPVNPYCVLSIRGITGESLVEYDKNSEVVEYFVCPQAAKYTWVLEILINANQIATDTLCLKSARRLWNCRPRHLSESTLLGTLHCNS